MEETKPTATHKVSFYGIRCWFDCHTGTLWGVNWLCDQLLIPASALHNVISWFACVDRPFVFTVIEEL